MTSPLCVIAYPRSGSTLFIELLKHIEGVCALYEIFHKDEVVAQQAMQGIWPQVAAVLANNGEAASVSAQRLRPVRLVRVLSEAVGGKVLAFKVFPSHLKRPALERLLPHTTPVFLYRNLLDSWVSGRIATFTGQWQGAATHHLQVEFDPEHFVRNALFVTRYLRYALSCCFKRNQHWLWYDYVDFQHTEVFQARLRHDLAMVGDHQAGAYRPFTVGLSKQDSRPSPLEKLSNPSFASEWLLRWDMAMLLDPSARQDFTRLAGWLELVAMRNGWDRPKQAIWQPRVTRG